MSGVMELEADANAAVRESRRNLQEVWEQFEAEADHRLDVLLDEFSIVREPSIGMEFRENVMMYFEQKWRSMESAEHVAISERRYAASTLMADWDPAVQVHRRSLQGVWENFVTETDEHLSRVLDLFRTVREPAIGIKFRGKATSYFKRQWRSMESVLAVFAYLTSTAICPLQDQEYEKEVLQEGDNGILPCSGCTVTIHYTVSLVNGTSIDSTRAQNVPVKFIVGEGKVPKALDTAVRMMTKGEIAILTCGANYAFGITRFPTEIPPIGFVRFEVELIDVKGEDVSPNFNGGIEFFQNAIYTSYPAVGTIVNVHLIGKHDDRIFEERDVQFQLGDGYAFGIIEGVEIGLVKMCANSKAVLKIKSQFAFGRAGNPAFGVPPDAEVVYTVHLKNIETRGRTGPGGRDQEAEMRPPLRRRTRSS